MRRWPFVFSDQRESLLASWGLLLLRLGVGIDMMVNHGYGKLMRLSESPIQFSDPYGFGPALSLYLAVFAEFFCSIALALGLFTRAAVIPLAVTMLTALFIVHADDPWQRKELAFMFLMPYLTIFLAGPGRFSLDCLLKRTNPASQSVAVSSQAEPTA